MNKQSLGQILEACLLNYEGHGLSELLQFGIPERFAKAGILLCNYLKSLNIQNEI